jgi:hypothetical protein
MLEPDAGHGAKRGVHGVGHTIDELMRVHEIRVMPGMIGVTNLHTVKAGEVDVAWQLSAAGQVVHTPAAHEPNCNVITRSEGLEYMSGVVIQPRSGRINIEGRERPVKIR